MTHVGDEDVADYPPYPAEWTAEQRIAAYWHALNFTSFPGITEGWYAVSKSLERERERRTGRRNSA